MEDGAEAMHLDRRPGFVHELEGHDVLDMRAAQLSFQTWKISVKQKAGKKISSNMVCYGEVRSFLGRNGCGQIAGMG